MTIAPELDIREKAMNKAGERSYPIGEIIIRPDLDEVWTKRLKALLKHPSQKLGKWRVTGA
jgi:hypothetical protein